jgi:hypothetical protein
MPQTDIESQIVLFTKNIIHKKNAFTKSHFLIAFYSTLVKIIKKKIVTMIKQGCTVLNISIKM